jgi:rubredoxin
VGRLPHRPGSVETDARAIDPRIPPRSAPSPERHSFKEKLFRPGNTRKQIRDEAHANPATNAAPLSLALPRVKYMCESCGFIYDPEIGDPDGGIPPGTQFEDIPETWFCPVCGARKRDFEPYDE